MPALRSYGPPPVPGEPPALPFESRWRTRRRVENAALAGWLLDVPQDVTAALLRCDQPRVSRALGAGVARLLGRRTAAAVTDDERDRLHALLTGHLHALAELLCCEPAPSLADRLAMAQRLDALAATLRQG